jgi:lipopolysaccharide export system permease protein
MGSVVAGQFRSGMWIKDTLRDEAGEPLRVRFVNIGQLQPDRMSVAGLVQYTQHLRENRQDAQRYELALWKRLVYPFAVFVMLALALPFAYLQARAGGIGYKVFVGIMIGIAFHFMNGLSTHLGLLNTWPAWFAVSLPSMAALLVAFTMLWWVGRTR